MNLQSAKTIANQYLQIFAPACTRIEIVGSVKRGDKPEVHDLEFLMILNDKRPVPEFGKPKQIYFTLLDKILADLEYADIIKTASNPANGNKLKRRALCDTGEMNEFCMEIFIVTPRTWAIQNVIRTGPHLFSHRYVTNESVMAWDRNTDKKWRGFLPDQYQYISGETIIKEGDKILDLPEEQDAIKLLGHGWIAPEKRREFSLR